MQQAVAMLRVTDTGFEFTLSHQGELHFHRWIPSASSLLQGDAIPDAGVTETLVLQVQRSLDFIERHVRHLSVSELRLAPHQQGQWLDDFISANLALPLRKLDLAEHFDFSLTPDLQHRAAQADYFSALGACLRFSGPTPL